MASEKLKKCDPISYRDGLDAASKKRYEEKLSIIGGFDPYEEKTKWSSSVDILPGITYPDICFYLIYTPSPYTKEDLKAWKSMDAVNQLCFGWVRERGAIVKDEYVIVTAKVLHSQRLREKPLRPWIIAKPDGVIAGAHCDCMAGLGEACTHVAALLFSISTTVQIRDSKTVTEQAAYWLMPTAMKAVQYKEVSEINFQSAKTAKRKLDERIESTSSLESPSVQASTAKPVNVPVPSHSDFLKFCDKLNALKSKPALLSVIEPYANKYVPSVDTKDFPVDLTGLRNKDMIGLPFEELINHCKSIQITCSDQQSTNVESETRTQSKSTLWQKFRSGRITASNAKAVCTSTKPSQSLVKRLCYPGICTNLKTPAMQWGISHETSAKEVFMEYASKFHENPSLEDSGLVISTDYPFIGASPDGLFTCDCCGVACVEVKCPYTARNAEITEENVQCLTNVNGELCLKRNHPYYYQIQTQLGVLKSERGYFVIWTEQSLHIEEVYFNDEIWGEICSKSKSFFYNAILPELVGKHFTSVLPKCESHQKPFNDRTNCQSEQSSFGVQDNCTKDQSSCNKENDKQGDELYCICNQVESGKMIACDNIDCNIEWFHFECVGITKKPKGKWFCANCEKLRPYKKQKV